MNSVTEIDGPTSRRIEFLLNEAKCNAVRDQVITYAMRVISNVASIGRDASSSEIKLKNRFVSIRARDLLNSGISTSDWTTSTINEHPVPLKETWAWLVENSLNLDSNAVWDHFVKNRMVTVLVEEDRALTVSGLRSSSSNMTTRYEHVGIQICQLSDDPKIIIRR